MSRILTLAPLAVIVLLLGVFAIALLRPSEGSSDPFVGRSVTELNLPLMDYPGETADYRPSEVEGPYLLNVWASWCPPCRVEHPYFTLMADQGVPIYGIVYKDEVEDTDRFLDQLGDPFAGLAADPEGRVGFELGVTGPPETFLVDGNGIIRARWRGAVTDLVWIQRFERLWAEAGGEPVDWSAVEPR